MNFGGAAKDSARCATYSDENSVDFSRQTDAVCHKNSNEHAWKFLVSHMCFEKEIQPEKEKKQKGKKVTSVYTCILSFAFKIDLNFTNQICNRRSRTRRKF